MGWLDKAKAAAKVASDAAKELAEEVDSEFGGQDWYKETRKAAGGIGKGAAAVWGGTKEVSQEILEEIGETEFGKAVGDKTRAAGNFLGKLPILSLAGDTLKSKQGVNELHDLFQERPDDPVRAIWLAEALGRVQANMKTYTHVRSVTSPTYAIVTQSIKSASQLGEEPTDPTQIKLLKLAFFQSIEQLKENPRDAEALHVMARVYLAQNIPGEAVRFSKLAVVADPDNGLPWITLARAYFALDQLDNAKRAARRAIRAGAGYGNELLADAVLASSESSSGMQTIERYDQIRKCVTPQHRVDYLGVGMEGTSVLEGIGREQLKKLDTLFT